MQAADPHSHWYDGAFYARFVDPWLEGVRRAICSLVEPGSSVLDVGCGTGALAAQLAARCSRVMGVERSPRMAELARGRAAQCATGNVTILHGDAADVGVRDDFDYATASLVLHGVSRRERGALLETMRTAAEALIIADYPAEGLSLLDRISMDIPELLAGPAHFRHFRSYRADGGIPALLQRHGLRPEKSVNASGRAYRVVLAALE